MMELLYAFTTLTMPELMALLATLVALLTAMERLINAGAKALEVFTEFVRLVLYGDHGLDEP